VFLDVSYEEMKKRIGAIGCLKIWPSLDYDELTINMRQNNDGQYGKLLAEVIRVGKITQENQNLLSTRMIPQEQEHLSPKSAKHTTLFHKTENIPSY